MNKGEEPLGKFVITSSNSAITFEFLKKIRPDDVPYTALNGHIMDLSAGEHYPNRIAKSVRRYVNLSCIAATTFPC